MSSSVSFKTCCQTELEGRETLIRFANSRGIEVLLTDGNRNIQKVYGDAVMIKDGVCKLVEFKIERKYTGKLFVEEWSNFGINPGWLRTCKADYIWYYFMDVDLLYITTPAHCRKLVEGEHNFPMKQQKKHEQLNDARGYCIPVENFGRSYKCILS